MSNYNYEEALYKDVMANLSDYRPIDDFKDYDDYRDYLKDKMWSDDSVTGNGSGSYTMNTWKAREYVLDNIELAVQVYKNFDLDIGKDITNNDWEEIDLTIRCSLLNDAVDKVIDDIIEEKLYVEEGIEE